MRRGILLLAVLALAACDGGSRSNRLRITTSILPHAWLVRAIDPEAEVTALVGSGESPATYQPSDREVSGVMRSRVLFLTGVPFERGDWKRAVRASKTLRVVDLRAGLDLRPVEGHGHGEDDDDPHVWLSPKRLAIQVRTIAGALDGADPDGAARRRETVTRLLADLGALDRELGERLRPFAGRAVYVYHPSWGYLLDDYGLRQVAVEREGKEPSESELTDLISRVKADGVKVLFVQPQITGRSARAIADATGAKLVRIDPLAEDVIANLRRVGKEIAGALR